MKKNKIKKIIKAIMSKKKYKHSIRTKNMAVELARIYKLNEKKIAKAALLHDIGYFLDENKTNIELRHAKLGYEWCINNGIKSKKILNSILYHTTGNVDMDMFAKIIFIADKVEDGREYEGVEEIRKIAFANIDKAMIMIIENTKKYLEEKNKKIHFDTIELYRKLKENE